MTWERFKEEALEIASSDLNFKDKDDRHRALRETFINTADSDFDHMKRILLLREAHFAMGSPRAIRHRSHDGSRELFEEAERKVDDRFVQDWIEERKAAEANNKGLHQEAQRKKNLKYKGRLVNFAAVPNELVDLGLKPRELALWLVLKVYTYNGKESCFPGRATLAKKMGVGLVTVSKAIKGLEQKHLLKTKRRYMGQSNIYTLLDPKLAREKAKNGSKSD
jgi:DNA-binding MarR family transcriptional regulator